MGHPSPRTQQVDHPKKPSSAALANWALTQTRPVEEVIRLQSWIANEAGLKELETLLIEAPTLLYAVVSESIKTRLFSAEEECSLALVVTAERQLQQAVAKMFDSEAGDYVVTPPWNTYSRYDGELVLCGSIAGYWACQTTLAAAIEKAIVRLGMGRNLLEWKQRHSAHCARSLINWAHVSNADVNSFPASHRLASGIQEMVEKYCSLLTVPTRSGTASIVRRTLPVARQAAQQGLEAQH